MGEREEQIEKEIQERKARVAKILESLMDIEDNIGKTPGSKQHVDREAAAMFAELQVCGAALVAGAARLRLNLP
jgi:hypothetical protein